MKIGAHLAKNRGQIVVIEVIDNDMVCLFPFRFWNPWHLLGLPGLFMRERKRARGAKRWWAEINLADDPDPTEACQNSFDERTEDGPDSGNN